MTAKRTSLAGLNHSTIGIGAGAINTTGTRLLLPQVKSLKFLEVNSVLLHRTFDLPEDGPFALAGAQAKAEREAKAAAKVLDVSGREFSFFGHLGVTLMDDMSIRLTEVTASRELSVMESKQGGHEDFVNACELSSDSEFAISASSDRTLKRWETLTGYCTHTYVGHEGAVRGVDIHPSDKVFLSASADNTIRVWDVRKTAPRSVLFGHHGAVNDVSCSHAKSAPLVISGSNDESIRTWDLTSGKCRDVLEGHEIAVVAVALSPNAQLALSLSEDWKLFTWDLRSGECVRSLEGQVSWLKHIRIGGRV